MKETLYSRRSNLVIGFHGCDQLVVDNLAEGKCDLNPSRNDYDWLGNGIYFWENNEERALQFAIESSKRKNSTIKKPSVIAAVLDLGYCMDLTDSFYLKELKEAYNALECSFRLVGIPLPKNVGVKGSNEILIRKLDCSVIQLAHKINELTNPSTPYDSVKGVFWEGTPLYPGAGFSEKNHIQICVRNPNCIKGYFIPRKINQEYNNP